MPTAKVKCQDCRLLKTYRCEITMKYMMPDKPRYCRKFQVKTQTENSKSKQTTLNEQTLGY